MAALHAPEDQARAELYAVLGRLFSAAPDAPVLAALGASDTWPDDEGNPLAGAWNRLVLASRGMDAEAAEQEYTDLFIGVGKAECNLHASYWKPEASPRPLVAVRDELAALGLGRRAGATVYEDHLGALCEAMRMLVAGTDERAPAPLVTQKRFFERFLDGWTAECCDAITQSPVANYYRRVAEFTGLYLALERDSFAMD
ncbi:MAG TPA: molecular chaperone TorD family protein [Casimicrobiaceae bacterium]|nr:molecular chaperone TorD family protein [Casimicrobiaceae bacterium]